MKCLMVSHDASRTGAPIACERLAKIFISKGWEVRFILRRGGPIEESFRALGPTYVAIKNENGIRKDEFTDFLREFRPDFILINTAVPGDVALVLRSIYGKNIPLIAYIHELQDTIESEAGGGLFEALKQTADLYFAASQRVKENLVQRHNISEGDIYVLPGIVEKKFFNRAQKVALLENLKKEIPSLRENDFLVAGAGAASVRKGTELFIEVARRVAKLSGRIKFFWIGDAHERQFAIGLRQDLDKLGLGDTIKLLGTKQDASQYLACADLFFLSSREDPFPLVCLESGAAGVPSLAFSEAGGIGDYIEDDAGAMIAYRDLDQAVDYIFRLSNDKERHARLSLAAEEKVRARYSEEKIGDTVFEVLLKRGML